MVKLSKSEVLTPFIKWVGGKRQIVRFLKEYAPSHYSTYYEPFIGGGALLLSLQPERAVINDWNEELVNVWKVVKDFPNDLIKLLEVHKKNNSKDYYLNLRSADRDGRIAEMTPVERAARFIFMNKTGFNGLWRVNSKGQNNVPYGRYSNPKIISPSLEKVSSYLNENDVKITSGDYRAAVSEAVSNDFVYFDPPYIPVSPTSSFTSYTSNGFGLLQQEQLRDTAIELHNRGVKVMLSNADVPLIEELYSDSIFTINRVQASRAINSKGSGRGKVDEVIITTY
ncbi:DNA methyltransferase [Lentilactobacillus curieae]|uniref:Site-specific DNA-methyltransferase (adenine-specific) n=1 Tax=Lentilactobacillus curieae TaxID=1138822 RepID=A0A1S6QL13_9LACO|nr:DNA methyltransferase [Lentilactobacillus curieae]